MANGLTHIENFKSFIRDYDSYTTMCTFIGKEGILSFYISDQNQINIYYFEVFKHLRGKGICKNFFKFIKDYIRDSKFSSIRVMAISNNLLDRCLNKEGFKVSGSDRIFST